MKRFNNVPFSRSCIMIIVSSPPLTMYGRVVDLASSNYTRLHGKGVYCGKVVLEVHLASLRLDSQQPVAV